MFGVCKMIVFDDIGKKTKKTVDFVPCCRLKGGHAKSYPFAIAT